MIKLVNILQEITIKNYNSIPVEYGYDKDILTANIGGITYTLYEWDKNKLAIQISDDNFQSSDIDFNSEHLLKNLKKSNIKYTIIADNGTYAAEYVVIPNEYFNFPKDFLKEVKFKPFKGLPQHDWTFSMSPDEKEEAIKNEGLYYTSGIFYNKGWASRLNINGTSVNEITDFINSNFPDFSGEVSIVFIKNNDKEIEDIMDINPDIKSLIKIFSYGTQSFKYPQEKWNQYYVKLILIPDE